MGELPDTMLITVCAECLTAACWQGEFYCNKYKTADVRDLSVGQLRKLRLESSSYWEMDNNARVYRDKQRLKGNA